MTQYALAIDVGGTQIRAALIDSDGNIAHREATPTLAQQGRDDVLKRMVAIAVSVASRAERDSLMGVGVCMPGPIDPTSGVIYNPPNLPGWDGFSAKPELDSHLGISSVFGNDANLAALAEHVYGAGQGYPNMIYLTVSTGIGGGIIVDGKLYAGYRGFSGELGHMTIDRNGPLDNCGNVGCLEAMASGTAVGRMARERLAEGRQSSLREASGGDIESVNAQLVAEAAASGDALALEVMGEAATNLGIGIVSLLHIFDPEIIVIGGGMSQSLELLLPGINEEIGRHAMAHERDRRPVVKSKLGDDVGLLGAAALAFDADETHA